MQMSLPQVLERNFRRISKEYEAFAQEKDECRSCELYNHYKQVVQSEGNAKDPTFMIIGEAPGSDESEQNRPFIGQAGQRLRKTLKDYISIFNSETTLITNVIPCRPLDNKFPSDDNLVKDCRFKWLLREIQITMPKILILLGNSPLKWLADKTGITMQRGKWLDLNGEIAKYVSHGAFATYHPSYVIRSERMKNLEVSSNFDSDFARIAKEYTDRLNKQV